MPKRHNYSTFADKIYLTIAGSLWSMISLWPRSSASICFMSASLSTKSQMSMFCSMRSLCTDFGIMDTPRWAFHLSATWAAVLPYFAPISVSTGCVKIPRLPSASGFAANYWINRFTHIEINRLLKNKELSIAQISDKLNFSSPAYFTRYVKNAFGKSPQELRD